MKPLTCNYYLTFRCDDTCEFCDIWQKKEYQNFEEAGFDAVKKNLRDLRKLGVHLINFTGGETLLREDLPEILRFSKRLGFFNVLTTNGITYQEKAPLITGFVDHLIFSLDSPLSDEHDRVRGTSCYQSVIDGIKTAKQLGKNPMINFTVTRDTIQVLPDMADLAQKLRVLLWINPVYNWSGLEGFEKDSIDYIERYFTNKNVGLNLAGLRALRRGGNDTRSPICRAGSAVVTILPDNSLASPCLYLQKAKIKIDGDLAGMFKRKEVRLAASFNGREAQCKGCLAWDYLNPSFLRGVNKDLFLALYSIWSLFWKELSLKKGVAI